MSAVSTVAVPLPARPRRLERVASLAAVVFPASMGLVLVHLVDDAVVNRPDGTSIASNLATIAVPAAVAVALGPAQAAQQHLAHAGALDPAEVRAARRAPLAERT